MNAPAQNLPFWKRPIRIDRHGIRFAEHAPDSALSLSRPARAALIRQLATLTAVMPVSDAVQTLARQQGPGKQQQVLQRMNRALLGGSPLAAALPPRIFPAEIRATVAAGEASGQLPLLLDRLADTLDADIQLRSKLLSTLAYPALLLLIAVAVILIMLLFVVPDIAAQLTGSGAELPGLTIIVLAASALVQRFWSLIVGLPLLLGLLLWLWRRQAERRLAFDRALLRLPFIGPWLASIEAIRWARLLATMLAAGLPLAEAMQMTAPTLGNHAWQQAVLRMTSEIRAGASLSASLALLPAAPPLLLSLARAGETAGRLAPLLDSAATSLDRQLADRSRTILTLAEPVIIVVLGLLVGLIILAVLLPILELNTLAGAGIGR